MDNPELIRQIEYFLTSVVDCFIRNLLDIRDTSNVKSYVIYEVYVGLSHEFTCH